MDTFTFSVEDFILYILNRIEPQKNDRLKLNKIAFFVEFAYFFNTKNPLSTATYAAITNGPIIDQYATILTTMERANKIICDGYRIRPLKNPEHEPNADVQQFINPLIEKYAALNNSELIALSHQTDSWLITTNQGASWGEIIDKNLASLETFFVENHVESDEYTQISELPPLNKESLVAYEFN